MIDVWEILCGNLKDALEEGSVTRYRLLFAPWFSVLFFVLARSCLKIPDRWQWAMAFEPLVIYILSVLFSIIMVRICPDWLERIFLKLGAYTKKEGYYYLKDERYLERDSFKFFAKYFGVYLLIYMPLYMMAHIVASGSLCSSSSQSTIFDQIQYWFKVGEGAALWGELKAQYLNGGTLAEEKEQSQKKEPSVPVSSWEFLEAMSNKLGTRLRFFQRVLSVGAWEDEETAFFGAYKSMFLMLRDEKSIFVNNAFYHDWERAFFIPVHRFLLNDRKVVILSGLDMDSEKLIRWVREELESMIGISQSWIVKSWETGLRGWDITVVHYEDIPRFVCEEEVWKRIKGLFMVILEPSRMLTEMELRLELMAAHFRQMEMEPVYCFADRELDGLADTLSHVFRTKIHGIVAGMGRSADISYYGIEEGKDLKEEAPLSVGSVWELERLPKASIIIEDGNCNFYEICGLTAGRGAISSRVFVLAGEYALREYMWSNFREQAEIKSAVPVYFALYEDTERNRLLKLLHYGMTYVIEADFIKDLFPDRDIYDLRNGGIEKLAEKYLEFPVDSHILVDCGEGRFVLSEECRKGDWWQFREVYLIDEDGEPKVLGCRVMGKICQWWLPGQYILLHGCCYLILGLEKRQDKDVMLLRRSRSLEKLPTYRQNRSYSIGGIQWQIKTETEAGMRLEWWTVDLQVKTTGLTWQKKTGNLMEDGQTKVYVRDRVYRNRKILRLILVEDLPTAEEEQEMYEGLAVVFTELARTIFPHHYPYLAFVPIHQSKEGWSKEVLYQLGQITGTWEKGILVLEDSMEDIGILEAFARNFGQIMNLCHRYCGWEESRKNAEIESGLSGQAEDYHICAIQKAEIFWSRTDKKTENQMAAEQLATCQTNISDEKTEKTADYLGEVPRCSVCGKELSGFKFPVHIQRYCEKCMGRENCMADYAKSLDLAVEWLEDLGVIFSLKPRVRFCLIPWEFHWSLRMPVRAEGRDVVCRRHINREWIELHMIYGCVLIWARRNCEALQGMKGICNWKYKRDVRLAARWFQMQYMYLKRSEEDARVFRLCLTKGERKLLEGMERRCPYVKAKRLVKEDLRRLCVDNPIRELCRRKAV